MRAEVSAGKGSSTSYDSTLSEVFLGQALPWTVDHTDSLWALFTSGIEASAAQKRKERTDLTANYFLSALTQRRGGPDSLAVTAFDAAIIAAKDAVVLGPTGAPYPTGPATGLKLAWKSLNENRNPGKVFVEDYQRYYRRKIAKYFRGVIGAFLVSALKRGVSSKDQHDELQFHYRIGRSTHIGSLKPSTPAHPLAGRSLADLLLTSGEETIETLRKQYGPSFDAAGLFTDPREPHQTSGGRFVYLVEHDE